MKTATPTLTSSLSLPPDSYIYKILPLTTHLAAISSDDSLRIIDTHTFQESSNAIHTTHESVTCLEKCGEGSSLVFTSGRDGVVRCWDLRSGERAVEYRDDSNAAYLSLSFSENGPVVGTEYINSQASVIIWDTRAPQTPIQQYTESHNDDITVVSPVYSPYPFILNEQTPHNPIPTHPINQVHHHPQHPSRLLSGSTDGLLNIYNTTLPDEDDALIHVSNHGSSIARAGFLASDRLFGLSHDECFSIYPFDEDEDGGDHERGEVSVFGDLRPRLECEYVVDVVASFGSGRAVVGAGSHGSCRLDLVPLRMGGEGLWEFDAEGAVRLQDAHGEEIVRSICFDDEGQAIFTAGEDGKIRAWRTSDNDGNSQVGMQEEGIEGPKKKKKRKDLTEKGDGKARFKPY